MLAAHLLNRAGFGGTPREIDALYALGLERAVEVVTSFADDRYPNLAWQTARDFNAMQAALAGLPVADQRRQMKRKRREMRGKFWPLVSWWVHRMARSSNPFREKLTLFWHDHFATSMTKVCHPYLMWRQNQTLRENAHGDFRQLLRQISRDPAMMLWLDTATSTKRRPNENFGRELLELFTLGEGHYTERDIQEAARAFTGYKVNFTTEEFNFKSSDFDEREKCVLGVSGLLTGDDVIDICLSQPECARFICRKLWIYYVSEEPSPAVLESLAETFRREEYYIRPVLVQIFSCADFYSEMAIRSQIKSPLQWLIGLARQLELELPKDGLHLGSPLREMGQLPFMPPDVDGWPYGKEWITTAQLLFRYAFAKHLVAGGPLRLQDLGVLGTALKRREYPARKQPLVNVRALVTEQDRASPDSMVRSLAWRLFSDLENVDLKPFVEFASQAPYPVSDATVIELIYLMVSTPEYQLT